MDPALMTAWATVAIAANIGVFGAVTCTLIWRGIKSMDRSTTERAAARKAMSEADERRHAEAMAAIDAQRLAIEAQNHALERQGQALERQGQALERQGSALETQGLALQALLQRMAPAE